MKRYWIYFVVILTMVLSQACTSKSRKAATAESSPSESNSFLAFNGDYHEEIIKPELEAWLKVAKVMYPRVCDDTETRWAAETADSLGNELLKRKDLPIGEQIARLCEIEAYIAYGMSYVGAIIGTHSQPLVSKEVLNIITNTRKELDSLKKVNYEDADLLTTFEARAYSNFGLYIALTAPYGQPTPQYILDNQKMQDYNYYTLITDLFEKMTNTTQAYRYSYLVNNTTFFMTFCPLTFILASPKFKEKYQNEYIEIGGYFDSLVAPVKEKVPANLIFTLPPLSVDEFSEILRKSSQSRAKLIDLLASAISTLPDN